MRYFRRPRRVRPWALVATLAFGTVALPASADPPPVGPTTPATTPTPTTTSAPARRELDVPVEVHTLPNGLRVVLSPEHTAPTVAITVYYDVGARSEEQGRSGFAHLFEHMMFEGTPAVPKGEYDKLIARHGGASNATTSEDRTNYYATLPSNALELGLWLEADRMRSLDVTPENFENQRQTVLEERRQTYENEAYMPSLLRRDELVYGSYYPYAHSVIGSVEDLRRATFQQVRDFHSRYYVPNNAVISISGDFEPARALELVRRHFTDIPRRDLPPWRDPGFTEPTQERRESITDRHAELPAFHFVYPIPARRTPDHYALEILSLILGDGESSRLYQRLVKEREVANSIEVNTEDRRGPDLFTFFCVLAEGKRPAEAQSLIDREIADLAARGPTGRELEKSRNRVRAAFVLGLQSNLQRAQQLAEYQLYDGNAALLRTELDRYLAVTLEDVRRVADRYLRSNRRTVLEVQPASSAPANVAAPASAAPAARPAGGAR